jgi:hypothetical protein
MDPSVEFLNELFDPDVLHGMNKKQHYDLKQPEIDLKFPNCWVAVCRGIVMVAAPRKDTVMSILQKNGFNADAWIGKTKGEGRYKQTFNIWIREEK